MLIFFLNKNSKWLVRAMLFNWYEFHYSSTFIYFIDGDFFSQSDSKQNWSYRCVSQQDVSDCLNGINDNGYYTNVVQRLGGRRLMNKIPA